MESLLVGLFLNQDVHARHSVRERVDQNRARDGRDGNRRLATEIYVSTAENIINKENISYYVNCKVEAGVSESLPQGKVTVFCFLSRGINFCVKIS